MTSAVKWTLGVILVIGVLGFTTSFGWFSPGEQAVGWLAGLPSVQAAFGDPEHGPTDAFLTLLAFAALTPVVIVVSIVVFVLAVQQVAGTLTPLMRALRLPAATSTFLVSLSGLAVVVAVREVWMPPVLRTLGLVARAYIVWTATRPGGSP